MHVLSPERNRLWWHEWVRRTRGWATIEVIGDVEGHPIEMVSFGDGPLVRNVVVNIDCDEQLGQLVSRQLAKNSFAAKHAAQPRTNIITDADPVASARNTWWYDSPLSPMSPFRGFYRKFGKHKVARGYPGAPEHTYATPTHTAIGEATRRTKPDVLLKLDNATIGSGDVWWSLNMEQAAVAHQLYESARSFGLDLNEGMTEPAQRMPEHPAVHLGRRTPPEERTNGISLFEYAEELKAADSASWTPISLVTEYEVLRATTIRDNAALTALEDGTLTRGQAIASGELRAQQMWQPATTLSSADIDDPEIAFVVEMQQKHWNEALDQDRLDDPASVQDALYGFVSNPFFHLLRLAMVADSVAASGNPKGVTLQRHVQEQAHELIEFGGISINNLTRNNRAMLHGLDAVLPHAPSQQVTLA